MIRDITLADYPRLAEIWESAVRHTHDFLAEADFRYYKAQLPSYFPYVSLAGYEADGRLAGFIGTAGGNIEMLFVDNDCRGRGIGRRLVRYAVGVQGADRVDVNEQNAQAVGFYAHLGFRLASRSETDAEGKPYPILHLRLEPGAAVAGAEY